MFAETVLHWVGERRQWQALSSFNSWKVKHTAGVRGSIQVATTGLASWKEEESTGTRASSSRSSGKAETLVVEFRSKVSKSERKWCCRYLGTRRYGQVRKGMECILASSQCVGGWGPGGGEQRSKGNEEVRTWKVSTRC